MQEPIFNIGKILELMPHRYPFLLIDKVLSSSDPGGKSRVGKKAVGIKNVTFNEPYFTGHFPDRPIMPGVLQIEAMAQLAALSFYRVDDPPMEFLIAAVNDTRFRKPVVPGDQLRITSEITKERGPIVQVESKCWVDDEIVSESTILAHISVKSQRVKL